MTCSLEGLCTIFPIYGVDVLKQADREKNKLKVDTLILGLCPYQTILDKKSNIYMLQNMSTYGCIFKMYKIP